VTTGDYLSLPANVAEHLLTALAYDTGAMLGLQRLPLEDLPARAAAVQRQLALGHGAEFTSAEVDQGRLLSYCDGLERLVVLAQAARKEVSLL
jgi:hypothetical protein